MGLQYVKNALQVELMSDRNTTRFEDARRRHGALAPHATPLSVLAVLGETALERYPERDALTRALLVEHHERPHPFWSAILLAAYYPMLSRLRRRIVGDAFAPEDLDQLVVTTFLELVRDFPIDRRTDRLCMRLRQMTARRVFQAIGAERRERARLEFVDPDELAEKQHLRRPEVARSGRGARDPEDVDGVVDLLVEVAGGDLDEDELEVIVETRVRGEELRDHVARVCPGASGAERERTYQRLKRRRTRALERLQRLVRPPVPVRMAG